MCHSQLQTKGLALLPKRAVDVMSCEVSRFMQLTQNAVVPISYHVQRKVVNTIISLNFLLASLIDLSPTVNFILICSLRQLVLLQHSRLKSGQVETMLK